MAAPSFPDVHVTGVVHHYIRTDYDDDRGIIFYLGTAEVTPQMQRRRYKQNVMNDIAGKTLPFQKTYDGEAATVSVALSRFSNLAWETLLLAGSQNGMIGATNLGSSGAESRWSRGAPVYGNFTFELWQVYDNALNPLTLDPDLEIGWYWPQVELVSHDTIKAGTQAQILLMVFDCTAYWTGQAMATTVGVGEREFQLFSNLGDDFPPAVLVPQ